jgi:hypothetical protein
MEVDWPIIRPVKARELLASVHGWFTEEFDSLI